MEPTSSPGPARAPDPARAPGPDGLGGSDEPSEPAGGPVDVREGERPAAPPRRRSRRRARMLAGALVLPLVLAVGFALWWYEPWRPGLNDCTDTVAVPGGPSPTVEDPWGRRCEDIRDVLLARGLPEVDTWAEPRLHQHQHLTVEVDGEPVAVPAGIGIDRDGVPVSPLHTHTRDGLLHVESPQQRTYRFVELMAVWGVPITDTCLGTRCEGPDSRLVVFVNGVPWTRPIGELSLADRQAIDVRFGTARNVSAETIEPVDWSRWDV